MKACLFTLGCKQNEVESASLMRGLEERGYEVTDELGFADLYLLNTCAVTAEAEKKSRQAVARMRKFNPDAPVIVCGCAAEHDAQGFAKKEGVVLVTGAARKDKIFDLLASLRLHPDSPHKNTASFCGGPNKGGGVCEADGRGCGIFRETESEFCELPPPKRTKTRAYLRIQDGCNRFCSYCLIPYLRGRTRSRGAESILREAFNSGAKEIVLTGIDISSYRDRDTDLGALLLKLKNVPARIRLGSVEASLITEEFLSCMKEAGNVCPHFHLSLQSGSTAVLKAMNRKYTREEYLEKCALIYAHFPDAAITTDIIVGYPTEEEEDFLQSLSIVKEAGFSRVHAFPFSPRAGTAAAKLKDLPAAVKKERMARMLKAAEDAEREYVARFLGRTFNALFEDDGGYTENYLRVYAPGAREGGMYEIKLKKADMGAANCEIIKEIK